ncbi:signal peptidase II [Georgenia satyanarayanai]|uniref:Lipoprotein signal peptidase n=1 Tax=Georgenia satyanarayanai TaxID=860221 RepID=A0A2Y9AV46_9MICO|nr:signal peptidase II [Georgenia satyanarayanai]PYF97318.1 signal peptidase II [Georgenia satyanarayanai]SSA46099.1 signal peptidase II [Georgenia satyanarayanai]
MTTRNLASARSGTRARGTLLLTLVLLAAVDLAVKAWAGGALADGHSVNLGPIELRLGFNAGMAFSLGARLPAGVVLATTGLTITAVAVFAWRATRTATRSTWLPLAVILAGAVANLIDRASDGVVTDYLHTGWFPTFNLADVYITGGAITLMVAALTSGDRTENPTAAEL